MHPTENSFSRPFTLTGGLRRGAVSQRGLTGNESRTAGSFLSMRTCRVVTLSRLFSVSSARSRTPGRARATRVPCDWRLHRVDRSANSVTDEEWKVFERSRDQHRRKRAHRLIFTYSAQLTSVHRGARFFVHAGTITPSSVRTSLHTRFHSSRFQLFNELHLSWQKRNKKSIKAFLWNGF